MSLIMKKNRLKVVGYFLDMFGVNQNDGVNRFINSWKILIFCCFLNSFMKQRGVGSTSCKMENIWRELLAVFHWWTTQITPVEGR